MGKLILFIPGIHHNADNPHGWTDSAVEWVNIDHPGLGYVADKKEYEFSAIFRRFRLNEIARGVADWIIRARHAEIELVGHSNGGEVICRAIREVLKSGIGVTIKRVHLISAACDEDMEKNWIGPAIRAGIVKEVHVYNAEKDGAMTLALWSLRLGGWAGLGYGLMGKYGPRNYPISWDGRNVFVTVRSDRNHTNWFDADNFEETMRMLFATERSISK